MTHFAGLVLVDFNHGKSVTDVGEGKAFSAVADLVHQYCETDEWGADGTRYDWFQVGGRFTGLLTGYEPWNDEANFSECRFCEGTGVTTQAVADQYPAYAKHVGKPCIQCAVSYGGEPKPFPGRSLNFQFNPHDGDVALTNTIDMDRMRFVPHVLVTPDGEWHEKARHGMFASELPDEEGNEPKDEETWAREFSALLAKHRDTTIAVVVDFHV